MRQKFKKIFFERMYLTRSKNRVWDFVGRTWKVNVAFSRQFLNTSKHFSVWYQNVDKWNQQVFRILKTLCMFICTASTLALSTLEHVFVNITRHCLVNASRFWTELNRDWIFAVVSLNIHECYLRIYDFFTL